MVVNVVQIIFFVVVCNEVQVLPSITTHMDFNSYKRHNNYKEIHTLEKKRKTAVSQNLHVVPSRQPFRTIEVTNVPENVCSTYLRGYFECAGGPVENVNIVHQVQDGQKEYKAYITFVAAEVAYRLVHHRNLQINQIFTIKKADSVHQANINSIVLQSQIDNQALIVVEEPSRFITNKKSVPELPTGELRRSQALKLYAAKLKEDRVILPQTSSNILKFEDINDHCLLKIISCLNLIDKINLSKTSKRMQSLINPIFKKRTHFTFGKNLERMQDKLNEGLFPFYIDRLHVEQIPKGKLNLIGTNCGDQPILYPKLNMEMILQKMGRYIKSIHFEDFTSSDLDILSKFCPNVTTLEIRASKINLKYRSFQRNKNFFTKMEKLKIVDSRDLSYTEDVLNTIISVSNLSSLHLVNWKTIKDINFSEMHNLKFLEIVGCRDGLNNVSELLRNNNSITLAADFRADNHLFFSSPEILSNLKELDMKLSDCCNRDINECINLKALKRLETLTVSSDWLINNFNKGFALLNEIDTLTSITIAITQIDTDTLKCLGLIRNLKKLNLLRVRNEIEDMLPTSLHLYLPKLEEISILPSSWKSRYYTQPIIVATEKIVDMICTLEYLKVFSYSWMTWELLYQILVMLQTHKQRSIEIGIDKSILYCPRVKEFLAASKGIVKLRLIKEPGND